MVRNKFTTFVYIIIGLAIIGLFSQLFTNTANFFMNIFITLGIAAIIFAICYFFLFRNRTSSSDMKKYKQAVKQSKIKHKANTPQVNTQQATVKKRFSKKRPNHLRVIDGNKSKRKKRASN